MKRTIVSVSAALLLSGLMMHAVPAWAVHFVGLDRMDVVCGSDMHLKQATGVPGGVHTYAFGGACNLRLVTTDGPENYAAPPLVASAHWDEASNTYSESLHLLAAATFTHIWTGEPDIHLTTYPEVASFKCDVDPVINRGAHCTLVSQNDATGWHSSNDDQIDGFAWSANHNRPLLLGLATKAQAASLSQKKARPPISCDGLKLVHVRDRKGIRYYRFDGTCELYHTPDGSGGRRLTHMLVNASWNAAGQGAQESFNVLAPQNEGGGLYLAANYNCAADPFIHGNVQCSLEKPLNKVAPVYDPITDLRARHPIAAGKTNPAQVAKLIGPKRGPSRVNRGGAMANAHGKLHLPHGPARVNRGAATANGHAANLHIGSSHAPTPSRVASNRFAPRTLTPMHPGVMQRGARAKLADPMMRIMNDNESYDRSCRDTRKLILVTATVRNVGGPLPLHRWEVFVMEGGGAGLGSGGVWVPPLAPGAEATVHIPVLVLRSHVGQLPGTHWLKLISEGYGHKMTTALPPITLPAGICQPQMHMRSPAGMQRKANRGYPPSPCVGAKCQQARHLQTGSRMSSPNTKLNPQPEPPSSMHRLPAVQFK